MLEVENETGKVEDQVFEDIVEVKEVVPEKVPNVTEQNFSEIHFSFVIAYVDCDFQKVTNILSKDPSLVNMRSPFDGNTALHYACKFGDIALVRALAGNYKADVNIINHSGKTPLHYAAEFSKEEVARILVSNYSAKRDIRDYSGKLAVDWLSQDKRSSMEEILGKRHYGTAPRDDKADMGPPAGSRLSLKIKSFGSFLSSDPTSKHMKPSKSGDFSSLGPRPSPSHLSVDSGPHKLFSLGGMDIHSPLRKGSATKQDKPAIKGTFRDVNHGKPN